MHKDYIWNESTKRYVLRKNKIGKQIEKNFNRNYFIDVMKQNSPDDYDPIYFETFEKWTDDELQTCVFLGNHYYKATDMYDYIYSNRSNELIKDPITAKEISISNLKLIYKKNFKTYTGIDKYIFDKKNIYIKNEYIHNIQPLLPDNSVWSFLRISLQFDKKQYPQIVKNNILLGYVPLFINVQPLQYDEIPALDSSSTTEAIVSRITVLIESGKLFEFSSTKKITNVKTFDFLLKEPEQWLTYGYNHYKMVDVFTKNAPYFKLLQELEQLESL
jgi:hypothetical protein